ncbi:MAG: hypothetical protein LJE83_04735 [Gammaproteobacteria bacterium]|nr:hypothetical protein [Gammaproteobacteria bacterium]
MQWLLRIRIYIIIFLAMMLITAAVIFSVLRAVLPYATGYKNEIQLEITQQIGLPVVIDSIDAAIDWFSPRLKLIDVTIYDKRNKVPLFNFKEIFAELDVLASILHGELIVNDVGLVGADISIEKLSESEWLVQGIKFTSDGSNELPEKFLYMLENSDYLLHDSNIYYQDHTAGKLNISLLDINIDVKNRFNIHDIKASINLPEEYGRELAVAAHLSGDINALDGDIYIDAHKLNLKQWNAKFNFLEEYLVGADVDVSIWAKLENSEIQTLYTQLAATSLSINNKLTAKNWNKDYLSANFRYVYDNEHWNLAMSGFIFGEHSKPAWPQPADILISEDNEKYYLSANFLPVADLQEMLEVLLTKEVQADFDKFKSYQLQADIYNLNLQLPKQMSREQLLDKLYMDATLVDFAIVYPVADKRITLAGIDSSLHYENGQAVLDLMTQDAVINIAGLFRGPLQADIIQGELRLNYDGDNWQLSSNKLQVKNRHIDTYSRLDMQKSSAGNIFADLQTDFYGGRGKYAHDYLPVGVMRPGLVDWLDMAVVDGYIPGGSFILYGNLSDFPYHEHNGVFQVFFPVQDASLRFLKQWPLLTEATAAVKFNNSSLVVNNAKAKTQGSSLFNGYAEITDLANPFLTVSTDAHGKNEDIQSYIWNSPLDDMLGDAMRLFQFDGNSDLNLKIELPLNNKKHDVVIDGHLNLVDADLYYPALGYEITGLHGIVNFTRDSIFADSLKANVQNKPLVINAFTQKGDSGNEVLIRLDGMLGVDYLLQHYGWIPEDWLSGQSKWSMDFEIPYKPKDYLVRVKANSSLDGVVLQMSDRTKKPAAKKTGFTAEIDVLENDGLHVTARAFDNKTGIHDAAKPADVKSIDSGDILRLYATRDQHKVWDFNVFSEYITGKGELTEGLGQDTQIKLDVENIDLHALFASENNGKSGVLKPSDIPALSWNFKRLLWEDWVFTDVKIDTAWHKHGMLINNLSLKGPAMKLDAQGTWLTSWHGSHETDLRGTISGSNLGETLTGLGFQRSLDRCKYNAAFNTNWPAEPYDMSWANMTGDISFEMSDGEIVDVDPGAGGRLLGLLNIFKLTNRLVFDFDDVIRKGFSFDTIKGKFEFDNGQGSLKAFDVSAPAADINMFGSIGLLSRDYGLLMHVKPHTDSLTFASGTLLGGVVVGAGLALLQKVFDLGFIGHNVYSITGSWDDPVIKKIVERNTTSDSNINNEDDF